MACDNTGRPQRTSVPWRPAPGVARPIYVYSLRDPETRAIRYVGSTYSPALRLSLHMSNARRDAKRGHVGAKEAWLLDLAARGLRPLLTVGGSYGTRDEAERVEARAVRFIGRHHPLFNEREPGHGVIAKRIAGGLCVRCGAAAVPESRLCQAHTEDMRARSHKSYLKKRAARTPTYACSICHELGHNARTCRTRRAA